MAVVKIDRVRKQFGPITVLEEVDLEIRSGEFMVLVGPSGCGKSTLLRLVAGLEEVTSGTLSIGGKPMNGVSPKARGIAMVFQNYALYPHMTVRQNLAFSLKLAGIAPAEIEKRVQEAATILGIEAHLPKKPGQLSGGQKQRVAMGRAMVRHPQVFLFDEPLSNLDAQLRVRMRAEISLLHRRLGSTIIYVTHDQVEAMTLADRIAVMYQGRLEQVGSPLEVYHNPVSQFVASFIGTPSMNFLPCAGFPAVAAPAGAVTFGFRPENTFLGKGDGIFLGEARISLVEPLGSLAYVHVLLGTQALVVETRAQDLPALDSLVPISVPKASFFYFGATGKRVL